jgi:hypothetical protein
VEHFHDVPLFCQAFPHDNKSNDSDAGVWNPVGVRAVGGAGFRGYATGVANPRLWCVTPLAYLKGACQRFFVIFALFVVKTDSPRSHEGHEV